MLIYAAGYVIIKCSTFISFSSLDYKKIYIGLVKEKNMSNLMKRSIALLLVLIVCVSSLPAIGVTASAASYVYNWGERGEIATSLSDSAVDFYLDNNTSYNELAALSGSTNTSSVPSSALYKALKSLMTNAHTHQTNYAETKDLYRYTDCENGGGAISSFYSGKAIGPSWDGNWNREHTWPNSKGLGGNDENDIMMLRPTSTSENSSRGNTAYGKSSGYYNPNKESNGAYDLRGDVARIFLYVYVRWGNTSYAWGTSGVMESREVLLEWMEADPVDTWELGRNDAVESITGTRNVFVDYPELCFIMFGEDIPLDMTTPSGTCNHNNFDAGVTVAPTCTTEGYVLYTCQTAGCGRVRIDNKTAAKGHSYVDGVCTTCGDVEKPAPTVLTELKTGDVVIIGAPAYDMALSANKVATYYNAGVSYEGGFDSITDAERFVVTVNSDGTYTFTSKTGDVLALADEYSSLNTNGTHKTWTLEAKSGATGIFYLKNVGRGNYLEWYASKGNWSTYNGALSDLFEISFYLESNGGNNNNPGGNQGGTTPDTPDNPDTSCTHSYTAVIIAPTCTADGFTVFTCTLCSDKYTDNKVAATGHSYSNDKCTVCGAEKESSSVVTISFADTANRTEFSTSKQVWQQNGITVTNNKSASTVNVADYVNPARFYANSEVIIEYPGIVKLEINCVGLEAKYVNGWVAGAPANATFTSNGNIITLEFATPVDSITYTQLSAQSRANSITVYTGSTSTETPCEHSNIAFEGAVSASCIAEGHTGKIHCLDCNEIISDGEIVAKIGHSWLQADCYTPKTCSVCQQTDGDALGHDWIVVDNGKCCNRCFLCEVEVPGENAPDANEPVEIDHSKCEASGFEAFINAIINFFRSLFGMPKQCVCGKFYE